MSIDVMNTVWKHSSQKGGALLMLLAIADFADDDGFAWPSVTTLAKKARMSERNARYVLRSLEQAGEIQTTPRGGQHGTSGYVVLTSAKIAGGQSLPGAKRDSRGGKTRQQGGQPIAPKPSLTINEPSKDTTVPTGGTVPPTADDSAATVTERPTKAPKRRKTTTTTTLPDGYHDVRDAIVAVCRFDPATISRGTHVQIDAAAKALARAGVTGPDVRSVGAEWYRKDWRGERGNPPTVRQLQDQISMRRGPAVAADASHGGVMTEDDLARRWPGFVFTIPGTHKRAIKTLPALAAEGAVTLDGVDALDPSTWPADYRAAVQAMERLRAVAS